jgi:hypothetical protein
MRAMFKYEALSSQNCEHSFSSWKLILAFQGKQKFLHVFKVFAATAAAPIAPPG